MSDPAASRSPFREIVQPFLDLARSPRAVVGLNLNYGIEGFVYFGVLIYLGMYFTEYVGLGDANATRMVGVMAWGITLAMVFFGGRADRWGVRNSLIVAIALMVVGRAILAAAPVLGLSGGRVSSPMNAVAIAGILVVVLGYGIYQPAAYKAVREFTTPQTANMGYAMLYGVMNLGGWFPSFMSPIRERWGIQGAYVFFAATSAAGLILLAVLMSRRAVERATVSRGDAPAEANPWRGIGPWLRNHPLADPKFSFFIFCLIPVQTLLVHAWLTLPMYVNRAFQGSWVGEKFETATNLNSLLIFVLCPIVAALTARMNVYTMMIVGTAVMALPTFLLSPGPTVGGLFAYIVLMSIGEATWQPRFLQYAAEIAPEGRTGAYMGVAQLPWFLTKLIVSLYAGWFLARYCPEPSTGLPQNSGTMWTIHGCIALGSTAMLILARGWLGKDFKTKAG